MKVAAFFALVTTTRILLADAATYGNVALSYTDGTKDVTSTTPTNVQFTVELLKAVPNTKKITFTSAQNLFVRAGDLTEVSATQSGATKAVNCVASALTTVVCTVSETGGVAATAPLVIKLANGAGTTGQLAPLAAAGTQYSFTATTDEDTTALSLVGFTVQKAQVQSGSVVLPPSSHVTNTIPTSFEFQIQPRQQLTGDTDTITVTSDQVLFTAEGLLTTAAVAQPGNAALTQLNQVTCTVGTDKMTVTCTLAAGVTVTTSSQLVVSLTSGATAKIEKLGATATQYKFSYRTSKDTDTLGPQLGFVVMAPQLKSAAFALTPSTFITGTTPTEININVELRQPLTVGHKIVVSPNKKTLINGLGALTIKSVSNGQALSTTNFAAEVSTTALTITVKAGGSISNTAPFKISLVNGPVAKIAELGAVGEVVNFDFTTSLATTGLAVAGWTVVAAPANPVPGVSFLPAAVEAGATCAQIYDTSGFYTGNLVQFGKAVDASSKVETKTINGIYASTDCSGAEKTTTRRLAPKSMGSIRLDSALTNSFPANTEIAVVNTDYGPTCFPGDATVNVYGRGAMDIASLSVGDSVLVESAADGLTFAPVLGFLHKVPGTIGMSHESVTVVHSQGTFRASPNHLAFVLSEGGVRGDMPVSALRPGDQLLVQSASGKGMPSLILSIGLESASAGMYAPFTSSGALVVDGVIASNYGAPSSGVSLPHGAAHAAFFALRMFHHLDLGIASKLDLVLPFVKMMFQHLRLDKYA